MTRKTSPDDSEPILVKRLNAGEKKENGMKIPKSAYMHLSPKSVVKTRIGGRLVSMKVDNRGYMWPETLLWDQFVRLLQFDEVNDELVFTIGTDGVIRILRRRQRP